MKKLFVTGGTGLLGQQFLAQAAQANFEVLLGVRNPATAPQQFPSITFDLDQPDAPLDLAGVDTIVHLASNTQDLKADSDLMGIQGLLKAIESYPIQHFIYMSIVGVDQVPVKYFKNKHRVEQLIQQQGIPYSILRATQFFEFFEQEIDTQLKKRLAIVPNLRYQPIATTVVAQHLLQLCQGTPLQGIQEIGGPEVFFFKDAIWQYQQKSGDRSLVLGIPNPLLGKLGRALTTGKRVDGPLWGEYVRERFL